RAPAGPPLGTPGPALLTVPGSTTGLPRGGALPLAAARDTGGLSLPGGGIWALVGGEGDGLPLGAAGRDNLGSGVGSASVEEGGQGPALGAAAGDATEAALQAAFAEWASPGGPHARGARDTLAALGPFADELLCVSLAKEQAVLA